MKNAGRVLLVRVLGVGALLLAATSCTQKPASISEQIAKTYGLDSFGQVDAIRYTWNAAFGTVNVSRSWVWEPKTNRVSFDGKDMAGNPLKVTYLRSQLSSQAAVVKDEVDPGFTNDNYWVFFPFHAYWDSGATVEDSGMQKLPLGDGSAEKVTVKYPAGVGYTPGDTWTLFVDPDHRVQEFIYHRGGPKKPGEVIATWADYKKAGPLLFAMDHRGTADGAPLRIFFSDVAVKLAGSDTWLNAQ
jgi:hypothetical protein